MRLLRWSPFFVLLLLISTADPAVAAESTTIVELDLDQLLSGNHPDYRSGFPGQRVGLVLSGGGARGLAQIGVLKVIEESGLDVDLIAGTSMGGIIGGLWAAGFSADSIEKLATSLEWSGFFSDKPKRSTLFQTQREEGEKHILLLRFDGFTPTIPTALTAGQKLNSLLNSLSIEANYRCRHDFDRLRIPLRICAVDILTARPVVLDSGNLADALRATMAVPLAFTPLTVDTMMLMDGGLLRPIPVETARDAGAEFVIAVNTTSGLLPKEQISDPVDIANQTTTIMQLAARDKELQQADAVVTPDLGGHLATDFDDIGRLIAAGEEAMTEMLPDVLNGLESMASMETNADSVCVDSMVVPEFLRSDSVMQALGSRIRDYRFVSVTDIREAASGILKRGIAHSLKAELKVTNSANVLVFDGSSLVAIDSVGWVGNETLPSEKLEEAIRSLDRHHSYIEYLREVNQRLQSTYRKHGYDLMEVDSVRYDCTKGLTVFHISEGLVSKVIVSGNDRTKGWVIRRSFSLKEGEPFNLEKAERGMANIFSTGLFERVNFNVEYRSGMALVRIEVKEKKFNLVRLGAHYHDHYHAETFLDFADANVLGFSNELFFRVQYGEMRKRYSLHLKADRIFETYLTYHVMLYHDRMKRDRYEENESIGFNRERYTGAMFAFGQQLSKLGTVTAEAHAVRIRIDLPAFAGLRHRSLRKLTLRSRIDNLDRQPFPMRGVAAEFYFDFASDVFGGEDKFKKIYFDWRAQIPLNQVIGLQPSFAIGVANDELPIYEKFLLGGNRSLYGYKFNSLEGDKLFRGNLGVRLELPYGFYLIPRYDLGNVWTRFEEIRFSTLRHSFGCELSYDSPIGPVSVSYGRADEGFDRAYIDVGYGF